LSFKPTLLAEGTQSQHESLYWAFYERGGGHAVRMADWKGIQQPLSAPVRLYNLKDDLGEENDLAAKQPEIVAQIEMHMKKSFTPSPRWRFTK
jgi:hypothetical protein